MVERHWRAHKTTGTEQNLQEWKKALDNIFLKKAGMFSKKSLNQIVQFKTFSGFKKRLICN